MGVLKKMRKRITRMWWTWKLEGITTLTNIVSQVQGTGVKTTEIQLPIDNIVREGGGAENSKGSTILGKIKFKEN